MHESFEHQYDEAEQLEALLLRSDLMELFQAQASNADLYIPDDFSQPAEVILAGTHTTPQGEQEEVTIWQRADETGPNYLVMRRSSSGNHMGLVTNTSANNVWLGMPAMTYEDLASTRWILQPGATEWNVASAQQAAKDRATTDPYIHVRYHSRTAS